jgi:hypothetical protein
MNQGYCGLIGMRKDLPDEQCLIFICKEKKKKKKNKDET